MKIDIPCVCGSHDRDTVTLRDTLDFVRAVTVRNAVILLRTEQEDIDTAAILAALSEQYLLVGIESWTLADAKGKPLPVSRAAIHEHILARPEVAILIADEADEAYAGVVLPLLQRVSNSSPPGPTTEPTSATSSTPRRHPKRSSPSSTPSIPMVATETTTSPPAGASST